MSVIKENLRISHDIEDIGMILDSFQNNSDEIILTETHNNVLWNRIEKLLLSMDRQKNRGTDILIR